MTYRTWNLHSIYLGPHSEVVGREGEHTAQAWGSAFTGVGGGGLGFRGLTLYW